MVDVVVTGAHSYLGNALVHALQRHGHTVCGLVTPWARGDARALHVEYLTADLGSPLAPDIAARVGAASKVFHLAWKREPTAEASYAANHRMLRTLLAHAQPSCVVFVSSVAAAKSTLSAYGTTKWRVQEDAVREGCSAYACGLVMDDPPRTAFATLHAAVAGLPLRIRFFGPPNRVYPIAVDDVVESLAASVHAVTAAATYGLFLPGGIGVNQFLALLEAGSPRFRVPCPVPLAATTAMVRLLRWTPARGLAEKLTFFTKDDDALSRLPPAPGLTLARTKAMLAGTPEAPTTRAGTHG
jgi:nucleoside-diphosphate-sugar epimerase